jgi:hypothetical protein
MKAGFDGWVKCISPHESYDMACDCDDSTEWSGIWYQKPGNVNCQTRDQTIISHLICEIIHQRPSLPIICDASMEKCTGRECGKYSGGFET